MNPLFKALTGGFSPVQNTPAQSPQPMAGGPFGALQNVMQRARQIASGMQNPQQMIQQFMPDVPEEIRNDPEQIIQWMQQTGKVNPQMIQMARQMAGR